MTYGVNDVLGMAIRELLSLDEEHHIVAFDLKVQVDKIPTVMVELEVWDADKASGFATIFRSVRLQLKD